MHVSSLIVIFSFCGAVLNLLHFIGLEFFREIRHSYGSLWASRIWGFFAHPVLVPLYQNCSCKGENLRKNVKALPIVRVVARRWLTTQSWHHQAGSYMNCSGGLRLFLFPGWLRLVYNMKTSTHIPILFCIQHWCGGSPILETFHVTVWSM